MKAIALVLYVFKYAGRKFLVRLSSLVCFVRAIGLEFFDTLARALSNCWDASGPPKPALQKSFGVAFSRCTVHLLPVSVFILLL